MRIPFVALVSVIAAVGPLSSVACNVKCAGDTCSQAFEVGTVQTTTIHGAKAKDLRLKLENTDDFAQRKFAPLLRQLTIRPGATPDMIVHLTPYGVAGTAEEAHAHIGKVELSVEDKGDVVAITAGPPSFDASGSALVEIELPDGYTGAVDADLGTGADAVVDGVRNDVGLRTSGDITLTLVDYLGPATHPITPFIESEYGDIVVTVPASARLGFTLASTADMSVTGETSAWTVGDRTTPAEGPPERVVTGNGASPSWLVSAPLGHDNGGGKIQLVIR